MGTVMGGWAVMGGLGLARIWGERQERGCVVRRGGGGAQQLVPGALRHAVPRATRRHIQLTWKWRPHITTHTDVRP